ncbi:hypothetical protein SASPL_151242 [Salvia splendens]|uniref:HMA domain-containing protein n=1 Tax=Salvia splendens TaxID=180675 RepID=A0A8X8W8W6_SALSN|nr:hypothetical protein SASPL_151242 [Salvia splendens]
MGRKRPQEIVLKVFMHCEGCARKVRRCLKGFEGVENVITDCRASKVVVKDERADPIKVFKRVQRKSHRHVELISPIPKPPTPPEEPQKQPEMGEAKVEEKKEEPSVITVVLGDLMHCDACAQEIRKRILIMKGIESAEPNLANSQHPVMSCLEKADKSRFSRGSSKCKRPAKEERAGTHQERRGYCQRGCSHERLMDEVFGRGGDISHRQTIHLRIKETIAEDEGGQPARGREIVSPHSRHQKVSDPLVDPSLGKFERDGLRRSQTMISGKHGDEQSRF